jgi:hypothetical protein
MLVVGLDVWVYLVSLLVVWLVLICWVGDVGMVPPERCNRRLDTLIFQDATAQVRRMRTDYY